jgi:16S rRNA (adenine1518-N6/adenine1519-N6)-dimethyltransferase
MPTVKGLLRKYDIRPRKRLSQSFLIDPNITSKIAGLLEPGPADTVVEIGPGLGVLTGIIAPQVKKIIAIEIDPGLVEILNAEISRDNVSIVHEDFLKFDFPRVVDDCEPDNARVKVIGNVPYNISSAIVFRLLEFRHLISTAVLMLQKEVAERIAAGPGSRDYGIVSVIVSMYARIRREFVVPPGCFYPRPNVDSAVIKMTFRDRPLVQLENPELFRELVRASFAQRRKTLLNNLKNSRFHDSGQIENILDACAIDGRRRAESLSAEEFGSLSNEISRNI